MTKDEIQARFKEDMDRIHEKFFEQSPYKGQGLDAPIEWQEAETKAKQEALHRMTEALKEVENDN